MTEIKRYEVVSVDGVPAHRPSDSGRWVKHEDHAAYLVRQFDALHERVEAAERERDDLKENQTRALQLVARRERQVLRYQKEIARRDALALGAQQQKVVELPEPVKWPEIPFKYFSEEQVFSMLDAAGVKWEVKK